MKTKKKKNVHEQIDINEKALNIGIILKKKWIVINFMLMLRQYVTHIIYIHKSIFKYKLRYHIAYKQIVSLTKNKEFIQEMLRLLYRSFNYFCLLFTV